MKREASFVINYFKTMKCRITVGIIFPLVCPSTIIVNHASVFTTVGRLFETGFHYVILAFLVFTI